MGGSKRKHGHSEENEHNSDESLKEQVERKLAKMKNDTESPVKHEHSKNNGKEHKHKHKHKEHSKEHEHEHKKKDKEHKHKHKHKKAKTEETKPVGSAADSKPVAASKPVEASKPVKPVKAAAPDVAKFLKENEVSIDDPHHSDVTPILTFKALEGTDLDPRIEKVIAQFDKPTPIQAASWPYLFKGDDIISVAETGSGKTFGFGVPAIDHVVKSGNKALTVLVVSPTRELATQTYDNMKELTDAVGLNCVCIYGGVPKEEQRREVRRSQCVVATPGRLLDLIQEGSVDLQHVDYLILDEADRMLEKGFEEDIKAIISATRPKRQTLMFTATWPKEVRDLASTFMNQPVKVSIGNRDELSANKRIQQIVEVIDPYDKEHRLFQLLDKYTAHGRNSDRVLIFALYKKEASRIERSMERRGYDVAALHGDLSQQQRTQALDSFKRGDKTLLLATDVAARGLDIPNVKVVINLTFPLTAEDYVHRIGRTGRAGKTGIAHTLFTKEEKHLAGALMNVLRGANQPVPDDLLQFGSYTKKKTHSAYGAFFKDVDMTKKAKKVVFD